MQTLGLTDQIKALTQSRKDAGALLAGHDSVNGKYIGSIWKLFLNNPKEAWPGMVVMLAAHGVTPFPVPQILGAITGGLALGSKARSAGAIIRLAGAYSPNFRPRILPSAHSRDGTEDLRLQESRRGLRYTKSRTVNAAIQG